MVHHQRWSGTANTLDFRKLQCLFSPGKSNFWWSTIDWSENLRFFRSNSRNLKVWVWTGWEKKREMSLPGGSLDGLEVFSLEKAKFGGLFWDGFGRFLGRWKWSMKSWKFWGIGRLWGRGKRWRGILEVAGCIGSVVVDFGPEIGWFLWYFWWLWWMDGKWLKNGQKNDERTLKWRPGQFRHGCYGSGGVFGSF